MGKKLVPVAKKSDIPEGKIKEYKMEGKTIAVVNTDGEYLAFDGLCTHAQCALAGGMLDGHTVTCYCHGGQFDIKTGEVLALPPQSPINVYNVKIKGEYLFVEI
ncbi:non-heme iron oxygenase ferredoxin subunit [Patescibacteria group bacterium]|nr:non-heme iron oxygenase ferredoxin subunit [Patescibacteria group bacterium]MCL5797286.1 non-heme iron oxygenase ferredoxin subunit [Patescibacteria group bacterium]